ncbi:chromate efflux transporter [Thioalkalivibrio sp. ALJ16]|uniref:chromate efflux transporter n=1 Tax=Thioalkalivibrio sp. ALJ16 TaxID=1158762 RepID=UPI00036171F6|nr:chromate efflux transporter [Thioalkalivibrio sp. ALJ16]
MTQEREPQHHSSAPPPAPGRAEAFRYWLKLGLVSFGGAAGQIGMMHDELVERRHWVSEKRFLHALNYSMVLPGPEAQQLATYLGWLLHGTLGGLMAGLLFILPSLLLITGLSWVYLSFGDVAAVEAVFYGIKPAVVAIIVYAGWRIGGRVLNNGLLWIMAIAAFLAIFALNIPFPYIIIAAGMLGWLGSRIWPQRFQTGTAPAADEDRPRHPAVVDDDTPPAPWMQFRWSRVVRFLVVGLGLWAAVFGALLLVFGWDATLTRMGQFFTQTALVTFGGAYAVLPYVYQGGVETYGWLSPAQMIDGIALGEATPGPLIMVVTFVGFIGGWTQAFLGPDQVLLAALLGALVATFFTFLPSFLFILAGAPLVERTRGDLHFTGPLTGITAAVVGVIANLAVFFAWHVLWPQGFEAAPDVFSALLGIAAFIALARFRVGIIPLILACAALGAGFRLAL